MKKTPGRETNSLSPWMIALRTGEGAKKRVRGVRIKVTERVRQGGDDRKRK